MSTTTAKLVTAEDLLAMGDVGRCELLNGEIIMMAPAGGQHGGVAFEIGFLIGQHVRSKQLGRLFTAETGFLLARDPDTVRAPDLAFLSSNQLKGGINKGFLELVPALVVEVMSPHDTASEVAEKIQQWLAFGVTSVWVAEPRTKTITIHRAAREQHRFQTGDLLVDEALLPGFTLDVAEVFKAGE